VAPFYVHYIEDGLESSVQPEDSSEEVQEEVVFDVENANAIANPGAVVVPLQR